MNLTEIRSKYPQYADMSDQQIAEGLHKKFYSDIPFNDFAQKIGYQWAPENMPTRLETPEEVNARVKAKYGNMSIWDKLKNDLGTMAKGTTPIIRGAIKGVSAIPGLAADVGVSTRNLLTGSNYELPTQLQEQSLNQYLPLPNVPGDKTLEFLTSVATGAKIPAPQAAVQAPKGFVKPNADLVRQQTLAAGQQQGLVVPPATTNPTMLNRFLESLGGKIGTAQDAAAKNVKRFTQAGKEALGLSDDAPLTQEALQALRKEAGDAYETLRGAGQIVADEQYVDDLAKVTAKFTGAAKEFPKLAKNEISDVVAEVGKKEFSSDSAVDLLAILRDKTDDAFAQGNKGMGKAYKAITNAIENLMERSLSSSGKTGLVKNLKDARQLIAKSWTVENAFNPATGNVVGAKLANQLSKGKPMTGNLKMAGRFAQAFPKVSNAVDDSGSVRNTDVILGAGAAGVSSQPGWMLYPFVRQATRNFLLSPTGQKLAVPGQGIQPTPEQVLAALTAAEQARLGR
jgi:hypothetical protein